MKNLCAYVRWRPLRGCGSLLGLLVMLGQLPHAKAELSLAEAVSIAWQNDPWIAGSLYREEALAAQSDAEGSLPDPLLSLGFANLPTDTFNFDQEAMTQFKVGLVQTIPRGDTRSLKRQRLATLSSQQLHARNNRSALVEVEVSHVWLETYRAQESIRLIEEDRELFEHLVDVSESVYASGIGRARQQDIVRAQLELTRLEDRLTMLYQQQDVARARLGEWLAVAEPGQGVHWAPQREGWPHVLPRTLPNLMLREPDWVREQSGEAREAIHGIFIAHPAITGLDQKIAASTADVQIAEQKYKPEWKLNASYGYREDAADGTDRADFFSVGVAFDLPFFTSGRQDQQVRSAVANSEAVRTERTLMLRKMASDFNSQRARLLRLEQRLALYRNQLLKELREQADASLSAYTNDDGDFAEVVRSRIDELNARLDLHNLEVDRLKTIVRLNYYFARNDSMAGGETL